MTPQENSMLQDLVNKVEQTQLTEKDPEAEQMLFETLGRDPDALYKLAQTVLVQNYALNQAKAQIQQLQQQAAPPPQQPARATSFLGSLLGHREPSAPPAPQAYPPSQPQYQPVPQGYQQGPMYEAPPQYAAPYPPPQQPSAGGSFLRSAATTAAGVAAGAVAFEGIESLMHGFGHGGGGGWGGGGGFGSGFGERPVEETVVNNYYDEPRNEGGYGGRDEDRYAEHHEREASYDDRSQGNDRVEEASYQSDTDSTSFDDIPGDDFSNSGGDDII